MIYILTIMSGIIAMLYYVLLDQMNFDHLPVMIFFTILLLGMAGGAHYAKYARFSREHMSKLRYIGGLIVLGILALSATNYLELWHVAEPGLQKGFMVWLAVLAVIIFTVPVIDITIEDKSATAS